MYFQGALKPEEAAAAPAPAPAPADAAPAPLEEKPVAPAPGPKVEDKTDAQESSAVPTEALANLEVSDKQPEQGIPPAASAPPSDPKPAEEDSNEPTWPATTPDHPLTKLFALVPSIIDDASYSEIYGVQLSPTSPFHTKLILQKFLRANQGDVEKAKLQLLETLKWRKEFDPVSAVGESFEKERFEGLGYVVEVEGVPESSGVGGSGRDVVTFNVYGAVKDNKATFGDVDGFLRWRVGLMERSVQKLNLSNATTPIPDYGQGPDPYQGFQVHDYLQVSFLRQDPAVKAATKRTIEILSRHYPETLSRKFFVNVPIIMGWLYQATKLVVAKETAKKFTVLSYGNQLAGELGKGVPKAYGGEAGELEVVGEGMKLVHAEGKADDTTEKEGGK